jgi:hypothetical protein
MGSCTIADGVTGRHDHRHIHQGSEHVGGSEGREGEPYGPCQRASEKAQPRDEPGDKHPQGPQRTTNVRRD